MDALARFVMFCLLLSGSSRLIIKQGNDQIPFELAFHALLPTCEILAPWRMPEFIEKFKGPYKYPIRELKGMTNRI